MRFAWDENKDRRNRAKHGLSFETAALVFDDPFALSIPDRVADGELRWQTLGTVGNVVVLLVAHTVQGVDADEVIRIISARKATKRERKSYEEHRAQAT